jgi:GTPase SAR1 family protein
MGRPRERGYVTFMRVTDARELVARVVYWGPSGSGKTETLKALHGKLPRASLEREGDPLGEYLVADLGQVVGYEVSADVVEVAASGPTGPKILRLKGADAVVFVADSRRAHADANAESLAEVFRWLGPEGLALDDVDVVLQYNHCDSPDALPIEALDRALNPRSAPSFEAVAPRAVGVVEPFKTAMKLVLVRVQQLRPARKKKGQKG